MSRLSRCSLTMSRIHSWASWLHAYNRSSANTTSGRDLAYSTTAGTSTTPPMFVPHLQITAPTLGSSPLTSLSGGYSLWAMSEPREAPRLTDAMPAAGMPPGEYTFLGDTVWVTEEVAYRADRQRYAGSVLTMARALQTVRRDAAADLPALAEMASLTPARVAGAADRKGSLTVGKDADVVLLTDDLAVHTTIARGRVVHSL